jgi:hypothetical protein
MERRLAAIIAADVVGYSALMETDEVGPFDRLRAGRKELFEPELDKHHERIFKRGNRGAAPPGPAACCSRDIAAYEDSPVRARANN